MNFHNISEEGKRWLHNEKRHSSKLQEIDRKTKDCVPRELIEKIFQERTDGTAHRLCKTMKRKANELLPPAVGASDAHSQKGKASC